MAEKCINRNDSEKVSNMQKTNPKNCNRDQEGLKKYTDMAIDPGAKNVLSQPSYPIVTLLTVHSATPDISFSLQRLKCKQFAHTRPTISCIHLVLVKTIQAILSSDTNI